MIYVNKVDHLRTSAKFTMRALCPGCELSVSVSQRKTEHPFLVGMVLSPLTNCPAVCGESAVRQLRNGFSYPQLNI